MYDAMISRNQKGCLVFLIDQSGSMSDPCGIDATRSKAQMLADALNRLLATTVTRCTRELGRPARDYFDIAVIGYGSNAGVGSAFQGVLKGREWATLPEIEAGPIRIDERTKKVDDGAGGLVETRFKMPVWIDPVAENGTPMCQALDMCGRLISTWIGSHASSYPPVVFNISDGEATDGDPEATGRAILSASTQDGAALLFNVHISGASGAPIACPASEGPLPDQFAQKLFRISSVLPPKFLDEARKQQIAFQEGARGFIFNADASKLIELLDIGTRVMASHLR